MASLLRLRLLSLLHICICFSSLGGESVKRDRARPTTAQMSSRRRGGPCSWRQARDEDGRRSLLVFRGEGKGWEKGPNVRGGRNRGATGPFGDGRAPGRFSGKSQVLCWRRCDARARAAADPLLVVLAGETGRARPRLQALRWCVVVTVVDGTGLTAGSGRRIWPLTLGRPSGEGICLVIRAGEDTCSLESVCPGLSTPWRTITRYATLRDGLMPTPLLGPP